jgi:RNA polymerase primary sigma factor
MNYAKSESLDRYFKSIQNLNPLAKKEELELASKAKLGDSRAADRLITHNTKIVVTIANKNKGRGIEIDDLIQQGNLGLIDALKRFDPSKNVRFTTFAGSYVLKSINKLIDDCGRVVRIPVNQEYERYLDKKAGKEVANLSPVLIDDFVSSDDESSTKATNMFSVEPAIEVEHDRRHVNAKANSLLSQLKDRDRQVMELFYGVNCSGSRSAKDIAEELGMTQIRVYQILNASKKTLKQLA